MLEPRRVDVIHSDGRWLAGLAPEFESELEGASLMQLIETVQRAFPTQALLFVVDKLSLEGKAEAKAQFLVAKEKSAELVISSLQEF
jgi:hypothetical protein